MVDGNMTEKSEAGHRQGLRDRFLSGDAESRSDEMLLELLLAFAIGRKDVKPLAEELVRVFGSLSKVLSASQDELAKVKGLGQSSVALLKVVDFIATGAIGSVASKPSPAKATAGATQQKLFQKLPNEELKDCPESASSSR